MIENKYPAYSKYPKYMRLITRLQNDGYTWEIGAFHCYYLMPPPSPNASDLEKALRMGAPCYVGDRMSFIWATGIEAEVADVLNEIYPSEEA